MRGIATVLSFVVLLGCSWFGTSEEPEPNEDDGNGCNDPEPEPGPAPAACFIDSNVLGGSLHIWEGIRVELDRPVDEFDFSLVGPEGPVEGELSSDTANRTVSFEPDALLEPATDYLLQVDWTPREPICDPVALQIRTSDVGQKVDPADVEGRVYFIDPGRMYWPEPPGIGYFLGSMMDGLPLILGIDEVVTVTDDGRARLYGRLFLQTVCWPTGRIFEPVALWWDGAQAWAEPDDHPPETELSGGYLYDVEVSGWLAPGGTSVEGLSLRALVDTTPADAMVEDPYPGALCDQLGSNFAVPCVDCPEGPDGRCLWIAATGGQGLPIEEAPWNWPWVSTTFDDLVEEIGDAALDDPDCPEVLPIDCQFPSIEINCSADRLSGAFVLPLVLLALGCRRRR